MARIAGRTGNIYVDQSDAGTSSATALLYSAKWTLDASTDTFDVSAFGDTTKTYVTGLANAQGTANGFYDDATATGSTRLFTVATSAVARKTYLYPKTPTTAGPYFFGTAFWDVSYDADANGAVAISANFNAATPFYAQHT